MVTQKERPLMSDDHDYYVNVIFKKHLTAQGCLPNVYLTVWSQFGNLGSHFWTAAGSNLTKAKELGYIPTVSLRGKWYKQWINEYVKDLTKYCIYPNYALDSSCGFFLFFFVFLHWLMLHSLSLFECPDDNEVSLKTQGQINSMKLLNIAITNKLI